MKIVYLISHSCYNFIIALQEDVRRKRKEGLIFDYTNGKKIQSVIYLKSGEAILTSTVLTTLAQRMNQGGNE